MAVTLPNEILSITAKACVEPWTIRAVERDIRVLNSLALEGLQDLTNVKVVKKSFHDDTRGAMAEKFDGRFCIAEGTAWRINLELIVKQTATLWCRSLIRHLELPRLEDIHSLRLDTLLPNVQKITSNASYALVGAQVSVEAVFAGALDDEVKMTATTHFRNERQNFKRVWNPLLVRGVKLYLRAAVPLNAQQQVTFVINMKDVDQESLQWTNDD